MKNWGCAYVKGNTFQWTARYVTEEDARSSFISHMDEGHHAYLVKMKEPAPPFHTCSNKCSCVEEITAEVTALERYTGG